MILRPEQSMALVEHVDSRVQLDGCDHTLRFTEEWAMAQAIDWDDLLDLLEASGCFCDCEVVLNLDVEKVHAPLRPVRPPNAATWKLPESFKPEPGKVFDKVLICDPTKSGKSFAQRGEWLVPAPKDAIPRKRVRRSMHFFVGIHTGLPCEVGFVAAMEPISVEHFVNKVAAAGVAELKEFGVREAAFTLTRIQSLLIGMPAGTHFMEINDFSGKTEELRVHRIILANRSG